MNAAGNADPIGRAGVRGAARLQVVLALASWATLSGVLYASNALGRFGSANLREPYDVVALSSLVVFIGTLTVASLLRVRAEAAVALSSALLTASYYVRLFHIVSLGGGSVAVLPLVTIQRFDGVGSWSISIDLGQLGLITLLYLLLKGRPLGARFRGRFSRNPP